jgi:hypothetical protein
MVNLPYPNLREYNYAAGDENRVSGMWGSNNEVEPAGEKLRRYTYIQLATTCNEKEQPQDAKNNAELYAKCRETIWRNH